MFGLNCRVTTVYPSCRDPETGEPLYRCSGCKARLPMGAFRANSARAGCVSSHCRSCENERKRERRRQAKVRRFLAKLGLTA
jgi:hypothetical protein